jgi:hypothetical protein
MAGLHEFPLHAVHDEEKDIGLCRHLFGNELIFVKGCVL